MTDLAVVEHTIRCKMAWYVSGGWLVPNEVIFVCGHCEHQWRTANFLVVVNHSGKLGSECPTCGIFNLSAFAYCA